MIADLSDSTPDGLPEYDLCVVGSGPAGLTVTNELAGSGLRICVLESGRMKRPNRVCQASQFRYRSGRRSRQKSVRP